MEPKVIHNQRQTTIDVIQRGWDVLVKNLGITDAVRFIRAYYPGYGDSVKEIREFWGNKTVHEISEEIREAKKRGEI